MVAALRRDAQPRGRRCPAEPVPRDRRARRGARARPLVLPRARGAGRPLDDRRGARQDRRDLPGRRRRGVRRARSAGRDRRARRQGHRHGARAGAGRDDRGHGRAGHGRAAGGRRGLRPAAGSAAEEAGEAEGSRPAAEGHRAGPEARGSCRIEAKTGRKDTATPRAKGTPKAAPRPRRNRHRSPRRSQSRRQPAPDASPDSA